MAVLLTYRFWIKIKLEIYFYRTIYAMFRGMGMKADLYYNRLLKPVKRVFSCRALYNRMANIVNPDNLSQLSLANLILKSPQKALAHSPRWVKSQLTLKGS